MIRGFLKSLVATDGVKEKHFNIFKTLKFWSCFNFGFNEIVPTLSHHTPCLCIQSSSGDNAMYNDKKKFQLTIKNELQLRPQKYK